MVLGAVRMCEKNYADAMKGGANHTTAPRGRPPFGYRYVFGEWRHMETGDPFDPELHVAGVCARKQACMIRKYWANGGRERQLARYTRKRKPKPQQLTLCTDVSSGADKMHSGKTDRCERLPSSHSSPPAATCSLYLATRPSTLGANVA